MSKGTNGFFEPMFGAALAGGTVYYENNEYVLRALGIALLGGALGWLGKVMMKTFVLFLKKKWDERKG
jgi:hypothetical protein